MTVSAWSRSRRWIVVTAGGLVLLAGIAAGCGSETAPADAAYRLVIEPCQGAVAQRATAGAVGEDLIVTVAHPLEGARSLVLQSPDGGELSGSVVHLDLDTDLALIRTERILPARLTLDEPEGPGPVTIVTYAEADGPEIERGEILELLDVTLDGDGRRAAVKLAADISPGDSGAPVLSETGRMVAMIFATVRDDEIGWAVSSTEIQTALEALDQGRSRPLSLGC